MGTAAKDSIIHGGGSHLFTASTAHRKLGEFIDFEQQILGDAQQLDNVVQQDVDHWQGVERAQTSSIAEKQGPQGVAGMNADGEFSMPGSIRPPEPGARLVAARHHQSGPPRAGAAGLPTRTRDTNHASFRLKFRG